MPGISSRTARKTAVATGLSVLASVSVVLLLVPSLGGHPDGPGFWMSVICPLVIAGPASLWQFHQKETIERQRDELARMHVDLEDMHLQLRQLHRDLRWTVRRDPLTGGLNREAIFSALDKKAGIGAGAGALLVIDADNFKQINDRFGHLMGDEALRRFASVVDAEIGAAGLWGRVGGEEFLAYLPFGRAEAMAAAERIRRATETVALMAAGQRVPLSVSIGGASFSGPFDPIQMFRLADENLYRAKALGRNRVIVDGEALRSAAE